MSDVVVAAIISTGGTIGVAFLVWMVKQVWTAVTNLTGKVDENSREFREHRKWSSEAITSVLERLDYSNGWVNELVKSEEEQNVKLAHIEGRLDGREEAKR